MATVALGGFLSSMGVSQKSLIDIGNYVIDNKPSPNFFKMSDDAERTQGFIPSLLHDSEENVTKKKQGLTSLKERFTGKYDIYKIKNDWKLEYNVQFQTDFEEDFAEDFFE